MSTLPHIILIGPPGAGKSTVSKFLSQRFPLAIIATGKRLRREIASGSEIGRQIAHLIEQGQFAPDDLMNRLMEDWLASVPADQGILFDGYPRTVDQVNALQTMLAQHKRPIDVVVALNLSEEEAIHRLGGRRICQGGGESFTLHIDDADAVRRCEERGGTLTRRDDDAPEVIVERLRVYQRATAPLTDFFAEGGLLRTVDAKGTPEDVNTRVLAALGIPTTA